MDKKSLFYKTFLNYYLGTLDPQCLHNATRSWLIAKGYDPEVSSKPIIDEDGQKTYRPEYNTARTEASLLLAKPNIQKLMGEMLSKLYNDPQEAKNRLVELAMQNNNLSVAVTANKTLLKIHGLLVDKQTTNIPELERLTALVSNVLTIR